MTDQVKVNDLISRRDTDPGVAEPRPRDADLGVAEPLDDDAAAAEEDPVVVFAAPEHPLDDDARGVLPPRPMS